MKMPNGRAMMIIYLAVFALVTALGAILAVVAARDYYLARASLDWPKAPGSVISSYLRTEEKIPGLRALPGYSVTCQVEYEYQAGGRRYRATRVAFMARGFFDEPAAQVRRYPPGSVVTVRYPPGDPALAVLEPGGEIRNLLPLLSLAAVCLLTGGWFLHFAWRRGGRAGKASRP